MSKIQDLQAPLPESEIEFRIGVAKAPKGFSLLAYKTARTDVRRFNEVFGTKWYPKYHYDEMKNLVCTIYVYDEDIEQWVGRENVGVESNTEKTKGSYSDALKRAGFVWGVGAELYDFPFVWVSWDKWFEKNGKQYPTARTQDWTMKNGIIYDEKMNKVATVKFKANKSKADNNLNNKSEQPESKPEQPKKKPNAKQEQVDKIIHLNREGNRDEALKIYNAHEFTPEQYNQIKNG